MTDKNSKAQFVLNISLKIFNNLTLFLCNRLLIVKMCCVDYTSDWETFIDVNSYYIY